ncbi:MAG: hypothetical protein U0903_07275 [Planctomycetales bacterium]
MIVRRQAFHSFCLVLALALISGCGDGKKGPRTEESGGPGAKPPSNLVKVGGTVTIDGQPVPGVHVLLVPMAEVQKAQSESRRFTHVGQYGTTDKDGKWFYTTFSQGDGVEPGEYAVIFRWLPRLKERDDREDLNLALDVQETLPEVVTKAKGYDPKMGAIYTKYRGGGPGMIKINVEKGKPQTDLKFDLTSM